MDKLALTFQSSIYLWGLLTLLIPIAIHLLSKHKGKIVPFAHIALITVKNSPQLNQARLTQWLLLILRLLMLLVACGILGQLFWNKITESGEEIVLITADWLTQSSDAEKQQLIDKLNAKQASSLNDNPSWILIDGINQPIAQRTFSTEQILDFTPIISSILNSDVSSNNTSQVNAQPLNIWANVSYIAKLFHENQKITILTTNRLNQFSGQKVATNNPIDWQIKSLPKRSSETKFSASLMVISDANHQQQLIYMRGALNAIANTLPVDLAIEYVDSNEFANNLMVSPALTHIIYLAEAPLPKTLINTKTKLLDSEQLQGYTQPDFPLKLVTEIFTIQANNWFTENARLSNQQITQLPHFETINQQQINADKSQSLHPWLILFLVLLFVAERLLSEWPRKQNTQVEGE